MRHSDMGERWKPERPAADELRRRKARRLMAELETVRAEQRAAQAASPLDRSIAGFR